MCVTKQPNHLAVIGNQALGLHGFNPGAMVTPSNVRQWDILCGKSKRCVDHDGSRRFRSVIECHRERYDQALTKFDKTSVTRTIYDILSQAGSRFLKHNESLDLWEEISPMPARDKIGHALRFANRGSRRKRYTNSYSSEEDSKPAPATPLAQPIAPAHAPSQAQPTGAHSIQQVQSVGQSPVASLSTPMAGFVLGHGGRYIMVDSSFAPLSHSCEANQSIEPFAMVEKLETEEHALTVSMPPGVVMSSMGVHEEAQGATCNLWQKVAPSHATLSHSVSLMNSALCDSMHTTSQDDSAALELDPFVQGDLTADWDFDAEILSVLF